MGRPASSYAGFPAPCLQVPERTIERVARSARRHCLLQARCGQAEGELAADPAERLDHAFDGFVVARIGQAFTIALVPSIAEFHDDDLRLGLGAAADRERSGDWPAFGTDGRDIGRGIWLRSKFEERLVSRFGSSPEFSDCSEANFRSKRH